MASITKIQNQNGTSYRAHIRIKQNGHVVHSEAKSFPSRQIAKQWADAREFEIRERGLVDPSTHLTRRSCAIERARIKKPKGTVTVRKSKKGVRYLAQLRWREGSSKRSKAATFSSKEIASAWLDSLGSQVVKGLSGSDQHHLDARNPAPLSQAEVRESAATFSTVAGIYFLLLHGRVVYVGQSENVARRVCAHNDAGRIEFNAYSWVEVTDLARRLEVEAAYIRKFTPPANRVTPKK